MKKNPKWNLRNGENVFRVNMVNEISYLIPYPAENYSSVLNNLRGLSGAPDIFAIAIDPSSDERFTVFLREDKIISIESLEF